MTGSVGVEVRGRDVGSDLVAAHPVAVDERPALREGGGAGIVERVQQPTGEAVESDRDHGSAEPSRRDDHGLERLAVDTPAQLHAADARPHPDPALEVERGHVRRQVGVDLLGGRMQFELGRVGQVREGCHGSAGVGAHAGPDAAVGGGDVPLAADSVTGLEDRDVEVDLQEVLGGDQPARTATDDCDASPRS